LARRRNSDNFVAILGGCQTYSGGERNGEAVRYVTRGGY